MGFKWGISSAFSHLGESTKQCVVLRTPPFVHLFIAFLPLLPYTKNKIIGGALFVSILNFEGNNCTDCYKCFKNCPVGAIVFVKDRITVMENECIFCGACLSPCNQIKKGVNSKMQSVKDEIAGGKKVVAIVSATNDFLTSSLKSLGFYDVYDCSKSAHLMMEEYMKIAREGGQKNVITTYCPSVRLMVTRHYPHLIKYLAPLTTIPTLAARLYRKEKKADVIFAYIDGCVSARGLIKKGGEIDYILSYDDIEKWFWDLEQDFTFPDECKAQYLENSLRSAVSNTSRYSYIKLDGAERCRDGLQKLDNTIKGYFIDLKMCASHPYEKKTRMNYIYGMNGNGADVSDTFADESRKKRTVAHSEVVKVLHSIGKVKGKDQLNCERCGYESCKDFAKAIALGRAERRRCLPFIKERGDTTTDVIIQNTPNGVLVLNQKMEVISFNKSAQNILKHFQKSLKNQNINDILECDDFNLVMQTKKDILHKKVIYNSAQLILEQSLLCIERFESYVFIIKNITNEEYQTEKIMKAKEDTVLVAQKVIDKQMRVAQEIASLLGETTAETKVALNRLKKSILEEK